MHIQYYFRFNKFQTNPPSNYKYIKLIYFKYTRVSTICFKPVFLINFYNQSIFYSAISNNETGKVIKILSYITIQFYKDVL